MGKPKTNTSSKNFGILFVAVILFFFAIIILSSVLGGGGEVDDGGDKKIDTDVTFTAMTVDAEWRDDRSCKIRQVIDVKFNRSGKHGIYVDIPLDSGEKIRKLETSITSPARGRVPCAYEYEDGAKLLRLVVGDPDRTFGFGQTMSCEIAYEYLTPVHGENADYLHLNAIGYGFAVYIENVTATVTYPSAPMSGGIAEIYKGRNEKLAPAVSNGGKTFSVSVKELNPYNGITFKHEMPDGVLKPRNDFEGGLTISAAVVLLGIVVALMLLFGRDKELTPVVGYYPPLIECRDGKKRRMLPVQMGKLIDGNCSMEDVTSLIFYWASRGYIEIDEREDDTYFIRKVAVIDAVTPYENKMYAELFSSAESANTPDPDEVEIAMSVLRGKFSTHLTAVKSGVDKEYRGKLYNRFNTAISVMSVIAVTILSLGAVIFAPQRVNRDLQDMTGLFFIASLIGIYVYGTYVTMYHAKFTASMRNASFVALVVMAVVLPVVTSYFTIANNSMDLIERLVLAVAMGLASAIAPFLNKRTEYYNEQLNDITGFRNFLQDAEKSELELMLNDHPQYYYDILPYANVLGVSKIWQDKFNDLALDPPSYYRGHSGVFTLYTMTSLSNSVGSSLCHVPSSSGGSHSGGGFGGGGGGFGGGGGGSW